MGRIALRIAEAIYLYYTPEHNVVNIWNYEKGRTFREDTHQESALNEPQLITSMHHQGEVTELKFIDDEKLMTSSSNGSLELIQFSRPRQELQSISKWKNIHHFSSNSCPCTGFSVNLPNIITVGEDSRINILKIDVQAPIATIEDNISSCSINAVTCEGISEFITVDSMGRLKVWDLRQPYDKPAKVMVLSGEQTCLQCIDQHPNQPHVAITGSHDGSIIIWDLRQDKYPTVVLKAHMSTVWEVRFHRHFPNNLFTCSDDGSIWHWDGSLITSTNLPTSIRNFSDIEPANATNPWLISDVIRNKIRITSVAPHNKLPINSCDIINQDLICGTDGEAIIIAQDLLLK
ncbi:Nucleoporin Nup43 [Trichoplax sp. H2]|nr:Nucleoporin Nup43 [Trichoplax sp. H2]|eukprot:RDD45858.1 Nucleoporin Nup43 [Trichoplax sp. H2]